VEGRQSLGVGSVYSRAVVQEELTRRAVTTFRGVAQGSPEFRISGVRVRTMCQQEGYRFVVTVPCCQV
jgi:hypothetical protein